MRADMSPYSAKLADLTWTCFRMLLGTWKMGVPIFKPSALASGDNAMQQPSPLPNTTVGTPRSVGSHTRSQDT